MPPPSLKRLRRALGAAACVRGSGRFVFNELRRIDPPVERRYCLRESGLLVHLRQPLLDSWILEEVFRLRVYDPPPPAAAVLAELGQPPRVLDLGGHVGLFGLFVRRLYPDAVLTSFEPDPANGALLKRSLEANGLQDRWTVVEACAAAEAGSVEFDSAGHLSRANPDSTDAQDVERHITGVFPFLRGSAMFAPRRIRVPKVDVFPYLAEADFAKIDIEGMEWELIADPRWGEIAPRVLVFEYHPGTGPGARGEETLTTALEGAGYVVDEPERSGRAGTLWAWRPAMNRELPRPNTRASG